MSTTPPTIPQSTNLESTLKAKLKTARCVLYRCSVQTGQREFLLAVHATFAGRQRKRWGLIGGGIDWREDPTKAALRELKEELDIVVTPSHQLGTFEYKRSQHHIIAAQCFQEIDEYDTRELLQVEWFNRAEVLKLHADGELHAGYEHQAINRLEAQLTPSTPGIRLVS